MRKMQKLRAGTGVIVGEGLTEQHYFQHIKTKFGFDCQVQPRFCRQNSIYKIEKKIKELIPNKVVIICVFDADVSKRDDAEKQKIQSLKQKYRKNSYVKFCDSLPSIEYWFLLHFKETNKHFHNAEKAEEELKKYILNYEKEEKFLENSKWVEDMCGNNRLEQAISRAKQFSPADGSYSNIHMAFDVLQEK